MKERKTI